MSVRDADEHGIELEGFVHLLRMYASGNDFLDRDTQVAMVEIESGGTHVAALLDWEDVLAINEYTESLIARRAAHEAAEKVPV